MNDSNLFKYIVVTPSVINNQIRISYHTLVYNSYLEYTKEDDIEFKNSIIIKPKEIEFDYETIDKRIVCNIKISNLELNTKYIFRIRYLDNYSEIHSFKTFNNKVEYDMLMFCDFQHFNNNVTHPFIKMMKEKCDSKFMICSGDLVDTGGRILEWDWFFKDDTFNDMILATTCGDHEYWKTPFPNVIHMERPFIFNSIFNNEKNGITNALNTNYYIYYNRTLIIFLDMDNSNNSYGTLFDDEVSWFIETLKNQSNNYDYLMVVMHKSIYGSKEVDPNVRKYLTNKFNYLFDKYQVDLVLSGHDHIYSRTYPIRNDEINDEGIIYLDLGSSGNKFRNPTIDLYEDNLHAKVINLKENNYCLGAYLRIKYDKIIVDIYNNFNILMDSFIINKKNRG